MIKLDKGVPIPPRTRGHGPHRKFPWEEMEIGDSFFVPKKGKHYPQTDVSAKSYVKRHLATMAGKKFAARRNSEGVRIWRVA
jgi:hypothetical protein